VGTAASRLIQVRADGGRVVERVRVAAANGSLSLTGGTRDAVQSAVQQSQDVLPPPGRETVPTEGTPTPTPDNPPADPPETQPPATTPPNPPPATPPSTAPPTTAPPTTTPPTSPPTTEPPTSAPPETAAGQTGADGRSTVDDVPPTTVPSAP
jgi:hypothetical protein